MIVRGLALCALLSLPATAALAQSKPGSIEARLERVEADLAIRRVLVDYAAFLDGGDFASYVGLFTPDAEWTNASARYKGRPAIEKMLARWIDPAKPRAENKSTFHIITNPRIDIDGNHATSTSRYLFMQRGPDGSPRPALAGIYTDEFARQSDGQWKIKRRVATEIMPTSEEWAKIIASQPSGK